MTGVPFSPSGWSKVAFFLVVFFCARMERNPQRCGIGRAAERLHIQRAVVVDGNHSLPGVDRFTDCVGDLVWQPAMRNQWPAAEIDGLDVSVEVRVFPRGNRRTLI